jgi:HEPN domain-containing protein
MRDPKAECARWLSQADNDLAFARYASEGRFFHQACFHAQQAAEKALKAVHYNDGARAVLGHSAVGLLAKLLNSHPDLDRVHDLAAELDLFYIPTRYPNGLVEGTPHETFTRALAERATKAAEELLLAVKGEIS